VRPLDALTGLPQRDLFEESVQCAILSARAARRGFALLHIDLDRFKDVNELVGRDGADGVLRAAAARIASALDRHGTLARLEDDEFGAMLEGSASLPEAAKVARRMLELCRGGFVYACVSIRLTASIGISLYPAHAVNARALMQDAQRAMLRAKLQGRDRFYPELPTCFAGTDLPPRTARG